MKKILLTLTIVATLGLSANAQFYSNTNTQNDGFFSSSVPGGEYRDGTSGDEIFPVLPSMGLYSDQNAPVGSGLLLLAGMGVAYAMRRKND